MRIHLDTDLGADTDDLCALAMLLGWEGAELVGVTTSIERGGRRAGWVAYALSLAGREDVPVAAGADGCIGDLYVEPGFPGYWPEEVDPRPARPGEALDLLAASAESGATMVSVGPYTNLAMLEAARPGLLASAGVVVMGGHLTTPRRGLPPWGIREDFNVQQDRTAARVVFERCRPVVVPVAVTIEVTLRRSHLEELRSGGPLAGLLADQAEMHARDNDRDAIGRAWPGFPDDLLNFQYDPLACAVALGWDGVRIEDVGCRLEDRPGLLEMVPDLSAPPLRTAVEVDAPRFERAWMDAVLRASSR